MPTKKKPIKKKPVTKKPVTKKKRTPKPKPAPPPQDKYFAFRSSRTLSNIPIGPDDARFYIREMKRLFPLDGFHPTVTFVNKIGIADGTVVLGQGSYFACAIYLYKNGCNLDTLLHEFAHLLCPPSSESHGAEFFFTCDLIERELFSSQQDEPSEELRDFIRRMIHYRMYRRAPNYAWRDPVLFCDDG